MQEQSVSERSGGSVAAEATVLFVDDEPMLLELWEARFADEYDVRTAEGGEEALRRFDDDVDVVFLDRRMPETNGDEVVRRLREEGHETPVVMFTAVDPEHDVPAEYDEYVTKPMNGEQARRLIDRYAT